ncbi:hypothetical protein ODZ84_03885 [Chryseobacterium fluminis]|uniref:hypothetical protein n=1 Tax=Chryseobacterium fluminis TaxID=2983606 RepID=UPI00224D3071|nr:hypothetical protein [Chryseobacterium sp. MMS21-Ot14]UZT98723.1 hypothetical protein ODZ84_03885 [Chryseobacterium sp. MMS21-Ot14]
MDFTHLSRRKRGFSTKFNLVKIIQTIIKRLKTSCQCGELSLKDYFGEENTAELSVIQEKIKDFQQDFNVLLST